MAAGDKVVSGEKADIKPGNNLPLRNIPAGTLIHAVELRPGGGAKLARSAGASTANPCAPEVWNSSWPRSRAFRRARSAPATFSTGPSGSHAAINPGSNVQAISSRLWGSAFLPGKYSGVSLRSAGDPVLYLQDSPGVPRELRRKMLDGLATMNQKSYEAVGDPEIQTRIQQYEMAFRMQTSVPELADTSKESEATYNLYGDESKKPGTFAASTLMARRLLERGVRFVQIFHRGWDQHGNLPHDIAAQCRDIDQASYGLIQDLKQRGMLDDTLVIWGGEFGRTTYSQGQLSQTNYGRDHHPRAFSIWMAGGGVKGGFNYGETDDMSFNITDGAMHVRDLHATILNQLGIDHLRLSYKYQGLDNRLTGVLPARIVKEILT